MLDIAIAERFELCSGKFLVPWCDRVAQHKIHILLLARACLLADITKSRRDSQSGLYDWQVPKRQVWKKRRCE